MGYAKGQGADSAESSDSARDAQFQARVALYAGVTQRATTSTKEEVNKLVAARDKNAQAAIGDELKCPMCGTLFKKATYHHIFCGKKRSGQKVSCKDQYWNQVDDTRRERAKAWAER